MTEIWSAIAHLVGAVALFSIILTALGVMVGFVKPADALRRLGILLGCCIASLLVSQIVVSAWVAMPLWAKLLLFTSGSLMLALAISRSGKKSRDY